MVQLALPKIECTEYRENYGKFVAEPIEKGFGVVLGNSLRRVLLSSLKGAAVASVLIDGVTQEFSTIPNMKEDITEFLMNIRDIRIKCLSDSAESGKMMLDIKGKAEVYARDIMAGGSPMFEIMNPDLYLATLDTDGKLYVEFNIKLGKGYQPASTGDNVGIIVTSGGTSKEISLDAIYTPVIRANYAIESGGPGQGSSKERLVLEIWTDGTIDPVAAVGESAAILVEQFSCFTGLARTIAEKEEVEAWQKSIPADVYNMPLEKLNLSTHTYNSLRRGGITTTGQLLEKGIDGLMSLGGFGVKSKEEVDVALTELGVELSDALVDKDKKKKGRAKEASPEGDSE
ncbi:MAG: DNA-directed RNA polymerase subunit alpha [Dehalococcoidia bacterium]|nr:DNA-directed RNA polymerase subunit alpha [Dehalococcoidia bacterium]